MKDVTNCVIPYDSGALRVFHNEASGFRVLTSSGREVSIQRCDLAPELRGITADNLTRISKLVTLHLSRVGDGYALRLAGGLKGGGPIFAIITYVGATVGGGAMVLAGVATANPGLVAAGVSAVAAAPFAAAGAASLPTP